MKKQFTYYLIIIATFLATQTGFANDVDFNDFYVAENVIINVNISEVSNVDLSKFNKNEITEVFVKANTVLDNVDEIENAKLVFETLQNPTIENRQPTNNVIGSEVKGQNPTTNNQQPTTIKEFPFSSKNIFADFATFLFVPTSSTKPLKTITAATLIVYQNANLFDGTKRHAIISTKLNAKNLQTICIYTLFSRPPTV